MIDPSKVISIRIPIEHRDKFAQEATRRGLSANDLTRELVIAGLYATTQDTTKEDFIVKNVAFMTQVLSEVLAQTSPDDSDAILARCQERAARIFEILDGK